MTSLAIALFAIQAFGKGSRLSIKWIVPAPPDEKGLKEVPKSYKVVKP